MAIERRLTVDDLRGVALPDRWELVDGEVIPLSPSGNRSSRIGGRMYGKLLVDGEQAGYGTAYPADAGFVLFPDRRTVRGPDAAFVVKERAVPLDDPAFVPFPPDFVVEVLSPSDRIGEAIAKMGMYLEAGVRLAWLVHPERQTVTVFTPDAPPVTLVVGAVLDGGDVLPWLSLPVADLFAP
jgi:Uma2 family endonuclease